MRTSTMLTWLVVLGCELQHPTSPGTRLPDPPRPETPRNAEGSAVPVEPGAPQGLPPGHPSLNHPLDDSSSGNVNTGRAARRLDVDQLRQSYIAILGTSWVAPRPARAGEFLDFNASSEIDMFEFFSENLGRPDFVRRTEESNDPSIPFAKLASDAARYVCRRVAQADVTRPQAERRLMIHAHERDTAEGAASNVRRNLQALVLRFWSVDLAPDDPVIDGLFVLFRTASTRPGATPVDGWRVVCIDLAADPRFLMY